MALRCCGASHLIAAMILTILSTGFFIALGIQSHYLLGVAGAKGCEHLHPVDGSLGYGYLWEGTNPLDPYSAPTSLQNARKQCKSWVNHWRLISAAACLHIFLAILLYASFAYPYLIANMRFRRRSRERDVWERVHNCANTVDRQPGNSGAITEEILDQEMKSNSSKGKEKEFAGQQTVYNVTLKLIQVLGIYESISLCGYEELNASITGSQRNTRWLTWAIAITTVVMRLDLQYLPMRRDIYIRENWTNGKYVENIK
ncbi:hypothetical protein BDZ91DRAFT_768976 [Kalaharituber pfeilii]|nr:hypothetical protein BDZ91DRAFT_768976 [Kalaharituber pfeilii]